MPDNDNPESLDKINSLPIDFKIKSIVNNIANDIMYEKQKRSWWDSNTDNFINQRYGIREVKNFPWANCANYVIPLIDADINRIKPAYASLIDVYPIVIFEPYGDTDIEAAENREVYFDWLLKARMNFFNNYMLGLDYILEQGIVIWKITWKYSTRTYTEEVNLSELDPKILQALYDPIVNDDMLRQIFIEEFQVDDEHEDNIKEINRAIKKFREGKSKFKLTLRETKDDQPEVCPRSLRYDIVFPLETTDLNNAKFIDDKFQVSVNDLKIAMRDDKYITYADETVRSWAANYANDSKRRPGQRTVSGTVTSTPDEDNIWLHETCLWHDIDGDGIKERCICTWPDANPEMVLRFIELPYEHDMWPYVACKREINDPGFFASRGIPALDLDFQLGISTSFNQSVDNGTITNTPQVVMKENSLVNPRNMRYVPGERVVVRSQLSDYETRVLGNGSQPYLFNAAQYLKSWANERIGNVQSGLSQANNMPGAGGGGKKTDDEVNLISQSGSELQSLDLQVFQQQMSMVYFQIDALDNQFGNQEEINFVTNGQAHKMTRQEIQGRFKYVPNGRLDNSNPQLRMSKSFNMLKMFLNDPDIKQRELKRIALDDFDIKLARKIFKTDQEKAQESQQAQQQQQQAQQQALQLQLALKSGESNIELQREVTKNRDDAQTEVIKEKAFTPNDLQKYFGEMLVDVQEAKMLSTIKGAGEDDLPRG